MQTQPLSPPNAHFYTQLHQAAQRLLILDYDGTLAPFRTDRFEAKAYPGVIPLLEEIVRLPHSRLVIVTGRPVAELQPLLGMDPAPEIWGAHGWEHLDTLGHLEQFAPPSGLAKKMQLAQERIVQRLPDCRLDVKAGSLAVHWRGLPEAERQARETAIRALWEPLTDHGQIQLKAFDGGLELRVQGRDKGTAVKALLADMAEGTFAAYLGDDLTDEDAFQALGRHGVGILVRTEFRPTHAHWWLQPPGELLAFLQRWLAACRPEKK